MTPLQRARLFKWVLYGAVLVAASVIQDVVMSRFRILDATTDLVPCAIFLICLAEGSETGGLFTLISAFAYLFSGTAPGFYCVPFLTILAILVTIFRQALLQKGFLASLLCTGVALLVYELLGPSLTKAALTKAGDIRPLEEHVKNRRQIKLAEAQNRK